MTTAQLQASDPGYSVWVSASAGTGKTTVLTSRVLRLLLAGTNPSKILCLTYTKAGAAEMECRIKAKLCQWVTLPEQKLTEELFKLIGSTPQPETVARARKLFLETLETPDGIKIQTIHSFCQGLMRRFPLEAGIVPHFKVMDDKTTQELLKAARTRLLSDSEAYTPEIKLAVDNIFWRIREGVFSEVISDILNDCGMLEQAIMKAGGIANIKTAIFNLLGIEEGTSEEDVVKDAVIETNFDSLGLKTAGSLLLQEKGITFVERGRTICDWLEQDTIGRIDGFGKYIQAFLTRENEFRKGLLPTKSMITPDALINEQRRMLGIVTKIKKARIATLSASIIDIAYALLDFYSLEKSSKACLDYKDLIIKSANLLSNNDIAPWILYKLDGGIDHLLLDEAQDTSPEQWHIIDSLCSEFFAGSGARNIERTLFVVGDEKQSIFSFQGAAPEIFGKMQNKFQQLVESAGKQWRLVRLDESFRSAPVILQAVDVVMENIAKTQASSILGSHFPIATICHIPHHKTMFGKVEIWPVIEPEHKEEAHGWVMPLEYKDKQDPNKLLAEKIAENIDSWIKNGRILEATGRRVRAGDIMILLQKRRNMADNIISSLKKRQIPVAGHDRLIITEHIAVMDLIAVGNFLLLPEDDLSLACVLKSPLIGITEDELFQIAHNRGSKSLWHSLRNQQDNFAEAVSYLSTLLNKVDFLTPFAFFCYVLEAQGGRKKILQRLGEEASDPVDEFLSMALSYEQSHAPSMQGFLSWLESGESIIKRDMEQGGADTVRVMTVHGSKGLEAPIVIMPDTTAVPDSRKTRIFWHESKSGNVMLWPGRSSNEDEICTEIKQRKLAEQEAEYYRLLYVAMTRAKSELYIAGTRGRNSINEKSWFSIIFSAMSGIADKDKDGILTFCGGIPENIEAVQSLSHAETPLLPRHFLVEPLPEPTPTRPLAPSKFEDSTTSGVCSPSNGLQLLEGKIIHSLLEFLPDIPSAERFAKGRQFLLNKFTPIPELLPRIDDILLNVLSIMNMESLKEVFGKNSRAEVPVVGTTNGVVVSGRIDRLAVSGDMVIIVDYKTGRIPPKSESHINAGYLKQMHIYQNLIGEIYHDKVVECYLIWTEGAVVYKLPAPVSNGLKLSMHN